MAVTPEQKAELKNQHNLSQDEISHFAEVFEMFDKDGNNHIDMHELTEMISQVNHGVKPTDGELKRMMETVDADKNGHIDFPEFIVLMVNRRKYDNPEKEIEDAFKRFDLDNSGEIDRNEVKTVLISLGIKIEESGLDDILNLVDTDKNGTIDYKEFKDMYYMLGLKEKEKAAPKTEKKKAVKKKPIGCVVC